MIVKTVFLLALSGAASSKLKYRRTCDKVDPGHENQMPNVCSNYGNTVILERRITNLEDDTKAIHQIAKDTKSDLVNQANEISALKDDFENKFDELEKRLTSAERHLDNKTTQLENLEKETKAAFNDTRDLIHKFKDDFFNLNQTDNVTVTNVDLTKIQIANKDFSAKLSALQDANEKLKEDFTAKLTKLQEQLKEQKKVEEKLKEQINSLPNSNTTHVAFSAKLYHAKGTNPNLVFDRVFTNFGNAYNCRSGIFVAPLNGTYHFSFMTFGYGCYSNSGAYLVKNGARQVWTWEPLRIDTSDTTSNTVILVLNKGDQVNMKKWHNGRIFTAVFSGFLIFPL